MARFLFYDDKIINILLEEEKPSGGAAVQAYGWIRGLLETGQEVYVLTNTTQNELLKKESKNIMLIPLYDPKKGIRWIRWLYYRLPYMYKKIKEVKPDYLYQGVPGWTSFLIGIICSKLNVQYVHRISNDYMLDDRFNKHHSKPHRFFLRMGLKLSDHILCQNNYQLSIIKNEFPKKSVIKIANPIVLNYPDTGVDIYSRQYIAWIGIYQYQKNLPLLFEIASNLENEKFFIAGKESSTCDQQTLNYLNKLRELPNVTFVGFLRREQVLPFLSAAKFLLCTSHYEGFSNTFLESMTAGTPIITSKNVNPDSIISEYNLGIVYNDLPDLKRKYFSITPEVYKAMSKNVLDYVVQQHDYKTLAKRLMFSLNDNR